MDDEEWDEEWDELEDEVTEMMEWERRRPSTQPGPDCSGSDRRRGAEEEVKR